MAESTRLRLLGTVQVERDGETLRGFRSRKALALLGYLALQDQLIPRERLAELFWEGMPEPRGRANLSWVLSRISTFLPDCLLADRHSVKFRRTPAIWLDLEAYGKLEAQGDAASLAKAVALYRGEFLEGLLLEGCAEFEVWLVAEGRPWRYREDDSEWEELAVDTGGLEIGYGETRVVADGTVWLAGEELRMADGDPRFDGLYNDEMRLALEQGDEELDEDETGQEPGRED